MLGVRGASGNKRFSLASLASLASMKWRLQADLILDSAPRVYASGKWPGIFSWVRNVRHCCVVITCFEDEGLPWPDNATPYFLNSNEYGELDGKTWGERHREALSLVTAAIDDDASVLVHCQKGLHRTGSFITLWVALRMRGQGDTRPWLQVLSDAWECFRTKRQLRERSTGHRDYAAESWEAVLGLYRVEPTASVASVASAASLDPDDFGARGVRVAEPTSKARPSSKPRALLLAKAKTMPRAKLVARQAIHLRPAPKKRGKPEDRQC